MVGSFVTTHGTWMAAGSLADKTNYSNGPSTLPGHGPTRTQRKQVLKLEHYGRRQAHATQHQVQPEPTGSRGGIPGRPGP